MPQRLTYADEVDAHFGIPWTNDLKFDKGRACLCIKSGTDFLKMMRCTR